mgnify:CR=1 FL=1
MAEISRRQQKFSIIVLIRALLSNVLIALISSLLVVPILVLVVTMALIIVSIVASTAATAATVIATEFQGYDALCLDACDSNDDGIINLADSVYLLNFLFSFGNPTPDPGPYSSGEDPTEDSLDCALPAACN